MDAKSIFYYSWIIIGIAMLLIFIKMAIPKIKEVQSLEDPWIWFKDSRITHKVAELLIWIPFYLIVLWSLYESPTWVLNFIDQIDWIMIAGGLLAAYSFFDARKKYWWAYPIWGLAIWGIFGPWAAEEFLLPLLNGW